MGETYIDQMNRILTEKRATGTGGVRLFVPEGGDFSLEDVAHDFCKVEEARTNGALKAEKVTSLPF